MLLEVSEIADMAEDCSELQEVFSKIAVLDTEEDLDMEESPGQVKERTQTVINPETKAVTYKSTFIAMLNGDATLSNDR